MEVLSKLLTSVVPLYLFIGVGYFASKWWNLKSKFLSKLMLYALIPLLIIDNILQADIAQLLIVVTIVFALALAMSVPAWFTHQKLVKDFNPYLLYCGFSYFNVGWFGIPVVLALFGEKQMPLIISAYMGNVLYGDTIGYYLMSRSKDLPVKESVKNVIKIPAIYACAVAIVANLLGFKSPEFISPIMKVVSWIVSALGMVIIGIGLTKVNFKEIAYKMFGKLLGVRYVAAAVIMGLLVLAEMLLVGQLKSDEQKLLLLIPAFPIAANLVVFSSYLDTENENASLLVSLSSLISLVIVPIACLLLFAK
ncbi:AEC family transporter [Adhaeribacter swui]|uniref:AEC family transporter n=1 Tax=Adhaeribacter swui TaxID=2086471 RepID=A0A7G7GBZ9_9BACT|nr:AEC family transporter [Adhaeribacter swui]QNF34683.1 AEC family transporter [Adhaeribacter swui]